MRPASPRAQAGTIQACGARREVGVAASPAAATGVLGVYWEPVLGQMAGVQWTAFTPYRPTFSQKADAWLYQQKLNPV